MWGDGERVGVWGVGVRAGVVFGVRLGTSRLAPSPP